MKRKLLLGVPFLSAGLLCGYAPAQAPVAPQGTDSAAPAPVAATDPDSGPVVLEWVPPAMTELSAQAAVKSSFTLDRNMLTAAASLMADSDAPARQAVAKLDGVSVHMLRFGDAGAADPADLDAVREAYHLRGWKHLVSTTKAGGPVHNGTTDVWLVLNGANVRGAVVLAETPKSLTLVTVAGNLSPADILHLRGHFGIPNFDADDFKDAKDK